jgi:succinate-acetate transporter protein
MMFDSNVANIIVYGALEFSYIFNCAANFALADQALLIGNTFTKIAGVFGLVASVSGFYSLAHEFCEDSLPFKIPLGDTSRFFYRKAGRQTQC